MRQKPYHVTKNNVSLGRTLVPTRVENEIPVVVRNLVAGYEDGVDLLLDRELDCNAFAFCV